MRSKDEPILKKLEKDLMKFHKSGMPLLGIVPMENRISFIRQVVDSMRRINYVAHIREADHSPDRENPLSWLFDPLKAAVISAKRGDLEEAFWRVFIATHFGKNLRTGWKLSAEVYGALGQRRPWTWLEVSGDVKGFQQWLSRNHLALTGKFGNHRKYESLKPTTKGPGAVVASYVKWIESAGGHHQLIQTTEKKVGPDPRKMFAHLYESMVEVHRFGRTGRFDYLTMIAKLKLAPIDANLTYMVGATGPAKGARLLFSGEINAPIPVAVLESQLITLEKDLGTGMQVLEDSLCNWQKSPNFYLPFRG